MTPRAVLGGFTFLGKAFPRLMVSFLSCWAIVTLTKLCAEFFDDRKSVGLAVLSVGTVLFACELWSYWLVVWVGSGSPKEIFESNSRSDETGEDVELQALTSEPREEEQALMEQFVTAKQNGKPRYCLKCKCPKPDRTHHCRTCGRCVLRMDHHCPWFATCVGFKNHKYFILFLWYSWWFSTYCLIVSFCAIYKRLYIEKVPAKTTWVSLLTISTILTLCLGIFAGYSLYLLFTNVTVIESMEKVRYKTSLPITIHRFTPPPTSQTVGNAFDLGWLENSKQVMGDHIWQWFIPITFSRANLPNGQANNGCWFMTDANVVKEAIKVAQEEQQNLLREQEYRRWVRTRIGGQMVESQSPLLYEDDATLAASEHMKGSEYYKDLNVRNHDGYENDLEYLHNV